MKPTRLAVGRDGLATLDGEPGAGDTTDRASDRREAEAPLPYAERAGPNHQHPKAAAPERSRALGLTVLVFPSEAAAAVQERLAGIRGLRVVGSDALHPGQIPRADLCIVDESCAGDTPAVVRDLTERIGLRVIAVGDRDPSSPDALRCISEGADDYLSARSTPDEWAARVRAVARRRAPQPNGPETAELRAGDLTISIAQRQVWRDGTPVKLTHTEFSLLEILARHIDTPVPYARLIADVWGVEHLTARHYLRVYIRRLREKLEADPPHPRLITIESRAGYMLRSGGTGAQPSRTPLAPGTSTVEAR